MSESHPEPRTLEEARREVQETLAPHREVLEERAREGDSFGKKLNRILDLLDE